MTPSAKREAIGIMVEGHDLSATRAFQVARLSRAAYYRTGVDRAAQDRRVVDQNAIVECFNRSYRREVLDAHIFESLANAREITEDWLRAVYLTGELTPAGGLLGTVK